MTEVKVSAKMVKELRDRTGLGMMECKKALEESNGDVEVAIDNLRKSGQAKAAKKAGNIAADGAIIIAQGEGKAFLLEVNCQTDFVAKDDSFTAFAEKVANLALENNVTDVAAISALPSSYQYQHHRLHKTQQHRYVDHDGTMQCLRLQAFQRGESGCFHQFFVLVIHVLLLQFGHRHKAMQR